MFVLGGEDGRERRDNLPNNLQVVRNPMRERSVLFGARVYVHEIYILVLRWPFHVTDNINNRKAKIKVSRLAPRQILCLSFSLSLLLAVFNPSLKMADDHVTVRTSL